MNDVARITPDGWPRGSGYAHGCAARGRLLCIAGQIGWDPVDLTLVSHRFDEQAARALANVAAVLRAAGGRPEHLLRMTWYVTDGQAYHDSRPAIGRAWRRLFGQHYPAMSVVVVAGLVDPGALVEISADAVLPD